MGKLTINSGNIRLQDWCNKDIASNHELPVYCEELRFVRELPEQSTDGRCS